MLVLEFLNSWVTGWPGVWLGNLFVVWVNTLALISWALAALLGVILWILVRVLSPAHLHVSTVGSLWSTLNYLLLNRTSAALIWIVEWVDLYSHLLGVTDEHGTQ